AMVFGVAAFSLVVQGLSMGRLVRRLDVATRTEAERLYELFVGRAKAIDEALDAAERLHEASRIPTTVYRDFEAEYGEEKEDLNRAIAALLDEHPEIRRKELLVGERQVLAREKSAVLDALRSGVIGDDVGQRLLDEIDLKISSVDDGETTVTRRSEAVEEGGAYEEFWHEEARKFGLESAYEEDGERDGSAGEQGHDENSRETSDE
ncbi:MAG: sodium:proton antiporter, partial [Halanaeroarchaeum sp.]